MRKSTPSRSFVLYILLISTICMTTAAGAQWVEDGMLVEPAHYQPDPEHFQFSMRDLRMVDNGTCGVFLGWFVTDNTYNYYQQLNWSGELSWDPTVSWHLPCCVGSHQISSDNSGGLYLISSGNSGMSYDLTVAHLGPAGTVDDVDFFDGYPGPEQWRMHPVMMSDGITGAIVVWRDQPDYSSNVQIRAQRIIDNTTMLWESNGTILSDTTDSAYSPLVTSDGYNGAIVAWTSNRSGNNRIYAQRIDFQGDLLWTINGVETDETDNYQAGHMIIPCAPNGAVIAWLDKRNMGPGNDNDLFIQRLDGYGSLMWDDDGTPLCLATGTEEYPSAVTDGAGGTIVIWRDSRAGDYDIYAQRVNSAGSVMWTTDGIAIAAGPGDQRCPRICSDNSGGAIIAWVDESTGECDLYCASIDSSGAMLWGPGFVPICTAGGDQDAIVMTRHCAGGAFISWIDYRSSEYGEIRANWITPPTTDSDIPVLGEEIILGQNYPNPFNPSTTISFELKVATRINLKIFDSTGSLVRVLADARFGAGPHEEIWDGRNDRGIRVTSGVYYYQIKAGPKTLSRKMIMLR